MLLLKLKKALPFIVAMGFILVTATAIDYVRSGRVKPNETFTAKVQLAESESKKIELDNFITSDTIYKDKSRFGFAIVCTRGSYQTQTNSGNGIWCKKGFSRYFGLSSADDTSLENLYNYLRNSGWQPFGESGSLDNLKQTLNLNDRVGSVYFKNQDDLTATLSVARTDMRRNGSLCTSTLCQLADTKKKDFTAIAEISIFYETRPF